MRRRQEHAFLQPARARNNLTHQLVYDHRVTQNHHVLLESQLMFRHRLELPTYWPVFLTLLPGVIQLNQRHDLSIAPNPFGQVRHQDGSSLATLNSIDESKGIF